MSTIPESRTTRSNFGIMFIKSRIGPECGPRSCLFSPHGSRETKSPDNPIALTPPMLRPEQAVSLTSASTGEGPSMLSIVFTRMQLMTMQGIQNTSNRKS